ncbi:MAG: hypothetical protein ACRDX8_11145 [Acidimicrobiales bacterium]
MISLGSLNGVAHIAPGSATSAPAMVPDKIAFPASIRTANQVPGDTPYVEASSVYVAYETTTGLGLAGPAGQTRAITFPGYACGYPSVGPLPPAERATFQVHSTCPAGAVSLTVDALGDIWYESSALSKPFGHLVSSANS